MVPEPLGGVVAVFEVAAAPAEVALDGVLALEDFELPHAARFKPISAEMASAPVLVLITEAPD
jgi:hypothetical protein